MKNYIKPAIEMKKCFQNLDIATGPSIDTEVPVYPGGEGDNW